MSGGDDPRDGIRLLEARLAEIPQAIRRTAGELAPRLVFERAGVTATGLGSSRAHACLLTHLLADVCGVDARYTPVGALAASPPPDAAERVLVVFSQGLSPNGCVPLATARAWRRAIVVTATTEDSPGDRGERLRALLERGVEVVRFAGADEFGTLVRIVGPIAGAVAALGLARAIAAGFGREASVPALDPERAIAAIAEVRRLAPRLSPAELDRGIAFLASGGFGELADDLRLKIVEGALAPEPPVWDLLEFAHGPFQQIHDREITLVALARRDAAGEAALLDRLSSMLDPRRHRLVRIEATLPGPLAILEHEAALGEIVLADLRARGRDPRRWPGQGEDHPLYDLERVRPVPAALERLTWPEVEAAIAAGRTTLVLPLGAVEQHGPHLPLATDATIAGELAARLCRHFDDAVAAPVVAIGCSSEHAAFPGTLSLGAETLERVLADLLAPLHRHGFRRAFVFSAHGGNVAPLRAMAARLRAAVEPLELVVFDELDALAVAQHAESARHGISPEAAGHHAGEHETSILAALDPSAVRADRFEPGWVEPVADPQSLFYPSLRDRSPSGTVGDPRQAAAARGEAYLRAWVERLAAAYRPAANETR